MHSVNRSNENLCFKGLFLICVLLLIVYSNSFEAGWHLDDHPNIINNDRLHMEAPTVEAIKQAYTALPSDPGEKIWRPLPCLSLAFNWFWGQDDPFGYHWVNLILHMMTACFLYLTVNLLLRTPAVKDEFSRQNRHFVALLAACLWAVNPIQTQAVTYIIQRMAVMAAMFSILGLYAYLKARMAEGQNRWVCFMAVAFFFICALLSKENAVLLPFSILLIEFIFFRRGQVEMSEKWLSSRNTILVTFLLIALIAFVILNTTGNPINLGYYDKRPFTMWERLISQPRILIFYLSLLLYPAPWRLSIEHDINHSLSMIAPWTTLPAIITVIGIVVVAAMAVRKHPLLSFSILFFFLNHLVESTFLPLELVFEHRNYLPSCFLFMPVAYGIQRLLVLYHKRRRSLFLLLVVFVTILLTVNGLASYNRNKVWKNGYTLWYDAFKKAPGRARAMMALGVALGWGEKEIPNRYDIAMQLFKRASELPNARKNETAQIYGNIGLIHMIRGERLQAIESYSQALENSPAERKIRFDLVQALISMGRWREAEAQIDILLADKVATPSELGYKGFVNLWLDKPKTALGIYQKVLQAGYRDAFVYHNIGVAMTRVDELSRGYWYLQRALEVVENDSRGKMIIYFTMLENRYLADDAFGTKDTAYRLLAEFGLDEVLDTLRQLPLTRNYPPLNTVTINKILSRNLVDIAHVVDTP